MAALFQDGFALEVASRMTSHSAQDWKQILMRRKAELAAAALLVIMGANLLSVAARKSITIDEASAIPAGYYHLTTAAFQINSEHPPLPKMLAALPLLFIGTKAPPVTTGEDEYFARRTVDTAPRFWQANREHFLSIFFWARVPMIALTIALGCVIFAFTRKLFNASSALLAVAIFSLEPTMLAHGRIIKDVHVALAYAFFVFALYSYVMAPAVGRALLLGLASGIAPAMKFSMVVVAPVLVLVAGVLLVTASQRKPRRIEVLWQLALVAVAALVVINASYLFQHQPLTAADVRWLHESSPAQARAMLSVIGVLGKLVPPYFLFGICAVLLQETSSQPVFLLGHYSTVGWWYYFPAAFALKTTLPFLVVTVASLAWAGWELFRKHEAKFVAILAPVGLFLAMAMWTSIQVGIRHLIPIFPFLFIAGGAMLDRLWRARRMRIAARSALVVALAWMCVETVLAYPNYIPYMNQLASARPHWQYLSDSNIEWGDDIGGLAEYLKARGETRVRAALLGGQVILPLYGVEFDDLLAPPGTVLPETHYVALGASYLNGSTVPGWSEGSGRETIEQQHQFFAAYRALRPEAVFGNSIYLYRVKD
jgi:4-amino-4-deoxy-L-arabinose transferase-like glycosyltransferase